MYNWNDYVSFDLVCLWPDFLCLGRVKCVRLLISMSIRSDISFHRNLTFTAAVLSFTCVTSGKYPQTQCVFQRHLMRVNTVWSAWFPPFFTLPLGPHDIKLSAVYQRKLVTLFGRSKKRVCFIKTSFISDIGRFMRRLVGNNTIRTQTAVSMLFYVILY